MLLFNLKLPDRCLDMDDKRTPHFTSIQLDTSLNSTGRLTFERHRSHSNSRCRALDAYSCSYCYRHHHHHQSDDVIQDMHAHILPHSVTEQIKGNKGNDNTSCIALCMSDKLLLQLIVVTKEEFWMEETRRDKSLRGSQLQIRHLTTNRIPTCCTVKMQVRYTVIM